MCKLSITENLTILLVAMTLVGCVSPASQREWVAVSRVASGVVGRDVALKDRYRIVSSRVFLATDKILHDRFKQDLSDLIRMGDGACVFPEMEVMFPRVFTSAVVGRAVTVDLHLLPGGDANDNVYCRPNDGWWYNNAYARVAVLDAATGDVLGQECFSFAHGMTNSFCYVGTDAARKPIYAKNVFSDCQSRREKKDVQNFDSLAHSFFEGYAGAIVAALEKSENGGKRVTSGGNPPSYVACLRQLPNGIAGNQADNTMAAVGLLMGSMSAISAAQGARTASRVSAATGPGRAALYNASSANVMQGSAGATSALSGRSSVCPVCMGSRRCRPCNGLGYITSVAEVAATTTSPVRSAMANRNVSCKACGGSGNCRGCGGLGHR